MSYELHRVNVWIEVIAENADVAGRWVSAQLNSELDTDTSPVNDFEVTSVEQVTENESAIK